MSVQSQSNQSLTLTRSIPEMLESAVVVLLLLLFAEALLGPLLADESNPESSAVLRLMWLPAYGVILLLGVARLPSLVRLVFRMPIIIGLILLIAASTLWSIDQALTVRRTIAIGVTTLFGLYLAARYTWPDMLALFGVAWFILAIGSVIVSLGVPSLGIEQEGEHVGAWRGLWYQKNAMGGHMSRATLLFGFLAITQPRLRKFWTFGLVLSVALVLLSTSKTSLLGMILGGGVLLCGYLMRQGPVPALGVGWIGTVVGVALIVLIATQPAMVLELIGRDPTLTGRTDIWAALFDVINVRPWLGYGYAAFWGEESLQALYVREATEWEVPTAHNGWLETWISIGLLGVLLFAANFALTIARGIWTATSSWNGFFVLGFILQFFLFSMSESIILQQNAITWLTYMAVSAALVQQQLKPVKGWPSPSRRRRSFILSGDSGSL